MKPSGILRKAITILRTEGWGRGHFHSPQGYCALGAVAKAAGQNTDVDYESWKSEALEAVYAVSKFIPEYYRSDFPAPMRVWGYNDAIARGRCDIETLFCKTAHHLEEQEREEPASREAA